MAASCAILEDDRLIGEFYTDAHITHSQTIMPMAQALLQCTQSSLQDIDVFAVSVGPGSFTGLRIGVAAIKGMAQALGKLCFPVSTLEGLAYNLVSSGQNLNQGVACSAIDARCGQIYSALFDLDKGLPLVRITEDSALMTEDLCKQVALLCGERTANFIGDGASASVELMKTRFAESSVYTPGKCLLPPRAYSVGLAALYAITKGNQKAVPPEEIVPAYLKLPQAQLELQKKQNM